MLDRTLLTTWLKSDVIQHHQHMAASSSYANLLCVLYCTEYTGRRKNKKVVSQSNTVDEQNIFIFIEFVRWWHFYFNFSVHFIFFIIIFFISMIAWLHDFMLSSNSRTQPYSHLNGQRTWRNRDFFVAAIVEIFRIENVVQSPEWK